MDATKKILLVEDEPMLSNLLRQRLEKEGFQVVLARDGSEAIRFLKENKPGCRGCGGSGCGGLGLD